MARSALPGPDLPLDDREAAHLFCCVSFSGKTSSGGFGVVLRHLDHRKEISGRVEQTSANQMHLHAAVAALSALRRRMKVHLYTTSSYARDGATRWIPGWRQRGWETAAGKSVQHRDLWEKIDGLNQRHEVSWHLVDREKNAPAEVLAAKQLSGQALRSPAREGA
ncbi:MAG: ribonuclease H [Planctomycetota bacterium]